MILVCGLFGWKTPRARWREEMRAQVISKEEAIAKVREYAAANGLRFEEPGGVKLRLDEMKNAGDDGKPAERYVYHMYVGVRKGAPKVEVDAITGVVLAWRSLPR